jgi:hypothetical protein
MYNLLRRFCRKQLSVSNDKNNKHGVHTRILVVCAYFKTGLSLTFFQLIYSDGTPPPPPPLTNCQTKRATTHLFHHSYLQTLLLRAMFGRRQWTFEEMRARAERGRSSLNICWNKHLVWHFFSSVEPC